METVLVILGAIVAIAVIIGLCFLEDSDGNHYKGQAGSGEVERL